jgi:Fe-S-cluster-containing dehydrogenase component
MQRLGKVNVETVRRSAWIWSSTRCIGCNEGIETCRSLGDNGSATSPGTCSSEEEHVNWIEAQFAQIQQMGEAHYLARVKERELGRAFSRSCPG